MCMRFCTNYPADMNEPGAIGKTGDSILKRKLGNIKSGLQERAFYFIIADS